MSYDGIFSKQDLRRLIIPLIIEQILAVTVGMADTVMVSSAGDAAMSGVSLVDMINVLIINIFAALATGGAVVCSQFIGANERKKACSAAGQLLFISFLISAFICVVTLVLRSPILRLFYGDIAPDVRKSALTYFWISSLSYPFIAVYNAAAALFRSMGNSKVSMITSICMNIINVAGNALFVFGFHLGVAGVATSSLIARIFAAVTMVLLLNNPLHQIHISLKERFHPSLAVIRQILHIGVPNALENSMFQLGRILVVSIIAGFGTVQVAANAVANNLDAFGCIPGQAVNLAILTVVGQCVGAGDYVQAKFYTKKLIKFTYLVTIGLISLILLFLPLILKLYQASAEALELATILIFIHNGCAMLLWPVAFTLPNAIRAANDVKFTMIISIFSMWTFRILFSLILGKWLGMGAIGVWIAMVMDWIFRAALFLWRYLSGKWQKYHPETAE